MSFATELEKLAQLKEKGMITESEFDQQKKRLLTDSQSLSENQKSRATYVLLAFFFGSFGIHNFYAGYTKKAIIQLIMTLFLFWLIIPLIIVYIWVIIDMFTVKKDATGILMRTKGFKITIIILMLVFFLPLLLSVCSVGGVIFYSIAQTKYMANQITDATMKYMLVSNEATKIAPYLPSFEETGLPSPAGAQIEKAIPFNNSVATTIHFKNPKLCEETAKSLKSVCKDNRVFYMYTE